MLLSTNTHTVSVMRLIGALSILLLVTAMLSVTMSSRLPKLVREGVDNQCPSRPDELVITGTEYLRIKEGDPNLTARNPHLIEFIRRRILAPSRYKVKPYATNNTDYSQVGQSPLVDKLLGRKTEGFHLEVGAANGETMSNSLFFELERNWTGLLIEANPIFYEAMLRRNRHAYSINACLSPNNRTQVLAFNPAGLIGGLFGSMDDTHKKRHGQCIFSDFNPPRQIGLVHVFAASGAAYDVITTHKFGLGKKRLLLLRIKKQTIRPHRLESENDDNIINILSYRVNNLSQDD
ncbi:hypothetical protein CAPTEDRAFT_217868 [Capitella teleta]|uniref:Methyltransferase FkbM domain-containing protein n=1 Tax=Capitella teleta TaxID=283909 RepID=R7VGJ9_CAPTE|nr:hypothetical protein CAPTEDRAFT_217868 [Capitella teleta]|eukprot:ELU17724.1 hypothetical protein CAPTEDRAFT_217868 [Capitella teleta]